MHPSQGSSQSCGHGAYGSGLLPTLLRLGPKQGGMVYMGTAESLGCNLCVRETVCWHVCSSAGMRGIEWDKPWGSLKCDCVGVKFKGDACQIFIPPLCNGDCICFALPIFIAVFIRDMCVTSVHIWVCPGCISKLHWQAAFKIWLDILCNSVHVRTAAPNPTGRWHLWYD